MTKLYTIEELLHENVITIDKENFIKDEPNMKDFEKFVFRRLSNGGLNQNLDELSKEEYERYKKDVKSTIFNPVILKKIWEYRLSYIKSNTLEDYIVKKNISEICEYVLIYKKQIQKIKNGEKPDYPVSKDWPIMAQDAIERVKKDLNDLFLAKILPESLYLSSDKEESLLEHGFSGDYQEVSSEEVLSMIGIKVNAEDLAANKSK